MLIELGHFALILALMISLVQSVVPLIGAINGWYNWMKVGELTAVILFLLICFSFIALIVAFAFSDFSVRLVVQHSHSLKPLIYKIAGTWGNHEGSMLLWIFILALYGSLIAFLGKRIPLLLKARVLCVQAVILSAFTAFLLFTSNPFIRVMDPPIDGNGLNPILQDPGLAFHPPFLYLGYVGLSVTFSFALGALMQGNIDSSWARWVRPWTLSSWIFLTIGIALGSYWAYYELGWGGWWFWDPVENASFMPWLAATALLHSTIVVEKRNTLKSWTILLAIVAFSFSLIGTFIVRSGVLTSVHAFASDPTRGIYILLIITTTIVFSLVYYSIRFSQLKSTSQFAILSRESGLVVNNLLFSVSAFIVFIGTIWPLIIETLFQQKISVGAPFFNLAFTPFMVCLGFLLPFGVLLPWKRTRYEISLFHLKGLALLSIFFGIVIWFFQVEGNLVGPIGTSLAIWIVLGSLLDLLRRTKFCITDPLKSLSSLTKLPRSEIGKSLGHIGFGLMVFGISAVSAWEIEDIRLVPLQKSYDVGNYTIELKKISESKEKNYIFRRGTVLVKKNGREVTTLTPEKRFYPVQGAYTTEASIHTNAIRDLYVVLGEKNLENKWVVRTYIKPFIIWIWIGAFTIAIGGVLTLLDRRFRVGILNRKDRLRLKVN